MNSVKTNSDIEKATKKAVEALYGSDIQDLGLG